MADEAYFIRQPGGSVQGPFDVERIRGWIDEGRIRAEMEFSTDGSRWVEGSTLRDLFPASPPPPPPSRTPVAPATPTTPARRGAPAASRSRKSGGRAAEVIEERAVRKRALRKVVLPYAVVTVVCAAAATVCAFLPFSKIDVFGEPVFVDGIDSNTGRVLIVAACGGAVGALLALTGQNGRTTLLVAGIALLGALAMMVIRLGSHQEFIEAGDRMSLIRLLELEVTTELPRWIAIGACALGGLTALVGAWQYAATERELARRAR